MAICGRCKERGVSIGHVRSCYQGQGSVAVIEKPPATDPVQVKPPEVQAEVPAGRYVLLDERQDARFFQVDRPSKGKWKGWVFVSQLHGSSPDYRHQPLRGVERKQVLDFIALDPREAMERFGKMSGHCGKCHAPLTDPESLARGVGPVCAKGLGW